MGLIRRLRLEAATQRVHIAVEIRFGNVECKQMDNTTNSDCLYLCVAVAEARIATQ